MRSCTASPKSGRARIRIGSQLIVRESQTAVFFRDGNALDVFGPGRHTLVTYNIPLLVNAIGKLFNERTPFPAEVYFVSMREFADRKWGTPQPIIVRNPNMGLGVALLQGFGTYSFQIKDPQQFVTQIVGQQGIYPHHRISKPVCARCCSPSCRTCWARRRPSTACPS